MTDKQSIKICRCMLEKLWKESEDAGKEPEIVIGVRKNDDEVFILSGKLTLEKQKKVT